MKTGYYISNIDGQIHNVNDVKCQIEDGIVSVLDEDGCEIDRCALYASIFDLIQAIK